jgi:hypothetical protein
MNLLFVYNKGRVNRSRDHFISNVFSETHLLVVYSIILVLFYSLCHSFSIELCHHTVLNLQHYKFIYYFIYVP